jgi:hypothetical protein
MRGPEAPEKIRLVPDEWHLIYVGRLIDGRLFLVDSQLAYSSGQTRDFVCTFLFDVDGYLNGHRIDLLGWRGSYEKAVGQATFENHLAALGDYRIEEIWLRPFRVESHGVEFGFIADHDEDGWRVVFMPGNTLCFWPPWDSGEYDT